MIRSSIMTVVQNTTTAERPRTMFHHRCGPHLSYPPTMKSLFSLCLCGGVWVACSTGDKMVKYLPSSNNRPAGESINRHRRFTAAVANCYVPQIEIGSTRDNAATTRPPTWVRGREVEHLLRTYAVHFCSFDCKIALLNFPFLPPCGCDCCWVWVCWSCT